jgi:hypothetical protein
MKLAFLILAHKNPNQLTKLVDYLLLNECVVLIHIDKKSIAEFEDFISKYKHTHNLKIYSEYKVYWGSYNQIRATLFLLSQSVKNFQFDYVSLVSAQDLPIKKLEAFKNYLKQSNDKDFVSYFKVSESNTWADNGGLDRMRLYWITNYNSNFKFIFSKVNVIIHKLQHAFNWYRPLKLELYGGSNWFTISFKSAKAVDEYVANRSDVVNSFKNTKSADEIVLGSLMMEAGCGKNIENNYLRYVDWQTGPESPRTFRINDFDRLNALENVFLARKFDEKTDNLVIEKIYQEILYK